MIRCIKVHEVIAKSIDDAIARCQHSQATQPAASVAYVLQELVAVRQEVSRQWPLPKSITSAIDLGPFAAKNIDDWNPELASALMSVDAQLKSGIVVSKTIHVQSSSRPNKIKPIATRAVPSPLTPPESLRERVTGGQAFVEARKRG